MIFAFRWERGIGGDELRHAVTYDEHTSPIRHLDRLPREGKDGAARAIVVPASHTGIEHDLPPALAQTMTEEIVLVAKSYARGCWLEEDLGGEVRRFEFAHRIEANRDAAESDR